MRKLTALLTAGLLLTLAACGGDTPDPTPTSEPTEAAILATLPPTATATALPAPPTATAPPTSTPVPTIEIIDDVAALGIVPTPTLPPSILAAAGLPATVPEAAPHPGYAESECSDKYPCNEDIAGWEARMRVPAGFQATYFARIDGQPTSLTFGPNGTLYVATLDGNIWTYDNGNWVPFMGGLDSPTALTFQPGTERLYVSSRVVSANVDGESQLSVIENDQMTQIIGGLPCCYAFMHSAHGIAFGPDGYGYIGVGARADHGEILGSDNQPDVLQEYEAAILRFSPDGSEVEVFARGLRNPYDIAWDGSGNLFASDNGPDFGPPDEFHRIIPGGEHGYPYYECDNCFGIPDDVAVIPPTFNFPAHSAPTGVTTYLSDQFPGYYDSVFVVLWSAFEGAQKVVHFGPGGIGGTDFAQGFAAPIDLTIGPDGSMYVADFATGIIFEIRYVGE